jgi:hypothetical protein
MGSATSGVLLPASFARPLSIFWVCEGSIPNPPNNVKCCAEDKAPVAILQVGKFKFKQKMDG